LNFVLLCYRDLYTLQDPQENTVSDVYSYEQFLAMCWAALEGNKLADAIGL